MRDAAHFDLVITDQTMPRMTGLELARGLLALRSDLPVILHAGFGNGISPQDIQAAGGACAGEQAHRAARAVRAAADTPAAPLKTPGRVNLYY